MLASFNGQEWNASQAHGGGPFGDSLANNVIYLFGWPAMIGVHIAFALLAWGAWKHYWQNVRGPGRDSAPLSAELEEA